MTKKLKYSEALEELEDIVAEIEEGKISVDELSTKIERASKLIRLCKAQLKSTEEEVEKILEEME
jgi:exodeoxyribonuclease VII small subunit